MILISILLISVLISCIEKKVGDQNLSKLRLGTRSFSIDSSNWVKNISLEYFKKSTNFRLSMSKKKRVNFLNYEKHTGFFIDDLKIGDDFIIKIYGIDKKQIHYFSDFKVTFGNVRKKQPNRLHQFKQNDHWHKGFNCDFNLISCGDR